MRIIYIAAVALFGVAATPALAQAPTLDPNRVMQPNEPPGTRESLPRSDKASNISPRDSTSAVAPTLPASPAGPDAAVLDYLRSARASLVAGRTGEAQQSLEMAQTRALAGTVSPDQLNVPSADPMVMRIRDALRALGDGDTARAIRSIDVALAG